MDDLAARLTERLRRRDEKIAALEARIAKADALAEVCHELSQEAYGYEYLYETTFHRDVHEKLEKALAAYREGSGT